MKDPGESTTKQMRGRSNHRRKGGVNTNRDLMVERSSHDGKEETRSANTDGIPRCEIHDMVQYHACYGEDSLAIHKHPDT